MVGVSVCLRKFALTITFPLNVLYVRYDLKKDEKIAYIHRHGRNVAEKHPYFKWLC